jgi:hypothetical protein
MEEYEETKGREGRLDKEGLCVLFELACSVLNVVTSDGYPFPSPKTRRRNTNT